MLSRTPLEALEGLVRLRVMLATCETADTARNIISMVLDSNILRPLYSIYSGPSQSNWSESQLLEARTEILLIFERITTNNSRIQSRIIKRRGLASFIISQLNVDDVALLTKSLVILGNIAADGGDVKDQILARGVMERLYRIY